MEKLTKKGEELLKEILQHRDDRGICDSQYWQKRFESLSSASDVVLRNLFKELREANMISVFWADDHPYNIYVLAKGITYFEEKQTEDDCQEKYTYTNNFFGTVNGIQIQQGTQKSTQTQTITYTLDERKLNDLIQIITKYDDVLDNEFGEENANNLRNVSSELATALHEGHDTKKISGLLECIRDLSINAGGGLISAGILQLISTIMV